MAGNDSVPGIKRPAIGALGRVDRTWNQHPAPASSLRTCPITQTGFVRISSNPSFTTDAATAAEALAALAELVTQPGHGFWPDDLDLAAVSGREALLATRRQVTDAYLLALAAAHDGVPATLDRGIRALARRTPDRLELILR